MTLIDDRGPCTVDDEAESMFRSLQSPGRRRWVAALRLRSRAGRGGADGPLEEFGRLTPVVTSDLAQRREDQRQAAAARAQAQRLSRLGRHQDAIAFYDEAKTIYARLGQEIEVARCTVGRANTWVRRGDFERALAGYNEARAVLVRLGRDAEAACCTMNRAVVLADTGRYEEALAGYDKARTALVRAGRESEVARCTANRANLLAATGRFEEALAGYDEAQAVLARCGDELEVADRVVFRRPLVGERAPCGVALELAAEDGCPDRL